MTKDTAKLAEVRLGLKSWLEDQRSEPQKRKRPDAAAIEQFMLGLPDKKIGILQSAINPKRDQIYQNLKTNVPFQGRKTIHHSK